MIQITEHDSYYIDEKSSSYFGFIREENIEDMESFYDEISRALSFPNSDATWMRWKICSATSTGYPFSMFFFLSEIQIR